MNQQMSEQTNQRQQTRLVWLDLVKFAMSKFVHYKNKLTQVLDHEADFGGLTGWCRAVVDTKCSPIDQQVILTPSLHQINVF